MITLLNCDNIQDEKVDEVAAKKNISEEDSEPQELKWIGLGCIVCLLIALGSKFIGSKSSNELKDKDNIDNLVEPKREEIAKDEKDVKKGDDCEKTPQSTNKPVEPTAIVNNSENDEDEEYIKHSTVINDTYKYNNENDNEQGANLEKGELSIISENLYEDSSVKEGDVKKSHVEQASEDDISISKAQLFDSYIAKSSGTEIENSQESDDQYSLDTSENLDEEGYESDTKMDEEESVLSGNNVSEPQITDEQMNIVNKDNVSEQNIMDETNEDDQIMKILRQVNTELTECLGTKYSRQGSILSWFEIIKKLDKNGLNESVLLNICMDDSTHINQIQKNIREQMYKVTNIFGLDKYIDDSSLTNDDIVKEIKTNISHNSTAINKVYWNSHNILHAEYCQYKGDPKVKSAFDAIFPEITAAS